MLRYYVLGLITILVIAGNIGCTKGVPIIESMSSLSDSSGGGTPSDPGMPATPVSLAVGAAFSVAPNWNDYIEVDANGARSNMACSSPSNAKYGSAGGCLHGGEIKKVVLPANFTSCVNLSLEDSLGVFNWRCEQTDSAVEFASLLKPGKGLADLVAPGGIGASPDWKKNTVTLFYKSTGGLKVVGESTPSVWWGNAIANAPVTGGTLAGSTGVQANVGKIYVVSSDLDISTSFVPDANKVGLVTLGAAKISSSSLITFIDNWSSSSEYFWMEGKLEGLPGAAMTALYGKYAWSRFQNLSLKNFKGSHSIHIENSEGLLIQNLLLRDSGKFYLASSDITAMDMRISFATGLGLYLNGANNNSFHRLVVNSTGGSSSGIQLSASNNNSFSQFAVMHADAVGVLASGTSAYNIFTHGNISKNRSHGLSLDAGVTNSFVSSIASFDHDTGLYLYDFKSYDSTARIYNSVYSGSIQTPSNWCGFGVGACSNSGDFTDLNSIQSGFLTNANTSTSYSSLLDAITTGDFFSRLFLSLSKSTLGSINSPDSNPYSLADWRLNANSPLYLRSFNGTVGDGTTKNPESVVNLSTGECSGEVAESFVTGGGQTILYHALEKAYDGEGDDDGLCEANETCYYAPNIGFYQGESSVSFPEVPHCKISSSNIKILKHGQYSVSY